MAETTVSGVAAKRVVITDECRDMHGDLGAFHKAAFALLNAYNEVTQQRGDEKGVNYHLVLTVDGTRGCGNCGNDLTVAPENEDPNPCDGCEDASNWKPRDGRVVKDSSERARRPTERLTKPVAPSSQLAPPEGSNGTAATTLTPEVEGKLHDAAQKDAQPSVTAGPIVIEGKPDDSSGEGNVGCGL